MNFLEAVKEMKKGKVCSHNVWFYKIVNGNLKCYNNVECTNLHRNQNVMLHEIEDVDWKVVDEDKDWNLADQFVGFPNPYNLSMSDIKKCRDLIKKDIASYNDDYICKSVKSQVIYHIDKRFGDLE